MTDLQIGGAGILVFLVFIQGLHANIQLKTLIAEVRSLQSKLK